MPSSDINFENFQDTNTATIKTPHSRQDLIELSVSLVAMDVRSRLTQALACAPRQAQKIIELVAMPGKSSSLGWYRKTNTLTINGPKGEQFVLNNFFHSTPAPFTKKDWVKQ